MKNYFGGVRTDPPNPGSAQKSENSSTLGLEYTVKKNLLHTIQEPLQKDFQNTPYFVQSDDFRTIGGFPKFRNFN